MPDGRQRTRGPLLAGLVAVTLLAGLALLSLCAGQPWVPPNGLLDAVRHGHEADAELGAVAVYELRLPRLIVAIMAGAAIAVAGMLLQEATSNPLAAPDLLGVGSGAALAVATVAVLQPTLPAAFLALPAVFGGITGGALVLLLTSRLIDPTAMLLVGAGVSAALSAMLIAVMSAAEGFQAQALFRYLSGSLTHVTWDVARPLMIALAILLPLTMLTAPALGVLRLGSRAAAALGSNVARARLVVAGVAVLLVCVVVSACGPLAWLGLLGPALVRAVAASTRPAPRLLLTGLAGAVLTVAADLCARLAFRPIETPVGAWTSAIAFLAVVVSVLFRRRVLQ